MKVLVLSEVVKLNNSEKGRKEVGDNGAMIMQYVINYISTGRSGRFNVDNKPQILQTKQDEKNIADVDKFAVENTYLYNIYRLYTEKQFILRLRALLAPV